MNGHVLNDHDRALVALTTADVPLDAIDRIIGIHRDRIRQHRADLAEAEGIVASMVRAITLREAEIEALAARAEQSA